MSKKYKSRGTYVQGKNILDRTGQLYISIYGNYDSIHNAQDFFYCLRQSELMFCCLELSFFYFFTKTCGEALFL